MSRGKPWAISEEDFQMLLDWLDPDRERAGEKFKQLYKALVQIFVWRGCVDAEGLADQTVDRVTKRLPHLRSSYSGDPTVYFYGVAKMVLKEYYVQKEQVSLLSDFLHAEYNPDLTEERDPTYDCLDKCLQTLPAQERELFLNYFEKSGREKIEARQQVAAQLGISPNLLRLNVHRIRVRLRACVEKCMQESG